MTTTIIGRNAASTLAQVEGITPTRRSRTLRQEAAQDARRALSAYQSGLKAGLATETGVLDLLRAMASCERALHAQTGGKFGSERANVRSVARGLGILP